MNQKKVFLLSGVPGSGKSTLVQSLLTPDDIWISRDNVRFSIIKDDEEYFSHEDEVYRIFISNINQALNIPNIKNIYVDATHLNKKTRKRTIFNLNRKNIKEINCIYFDIPIEICQERNNKRTGRALVPTNIIDDMFKNYHHPNKTENFKHIYKVDKDNNMKEVIFVNE